MSELQYRLTAIVDPLPEGASVTLPVTDLRRWLEEDLLESKRPAVALGDHPEVEDWTWREKLWTVSPETRLGVHELSEALGRSRSWIYRRTGSAAPTERIPHRKFEGELSFMADEIRIWIRSKEMVKPCLHSSLHASYRQSES